MATVAVARNVNNHTNTFGVNPLVKEEEEEQVRLAAKLQLSKSQLTTPSDRIEDVEILGHRGALYEGVENTLEAFQSCLDLEGCHGVELDVFLLKDGNLVVFHGTGGDQTPGLLDHICVPDNGTSKSILDLTLRQAQALRFLEESEHLVAPRERTKRARIPTLQQVLQLFQGSPKQIKIELKGEGTVQPAVQMVLDMNMTHQVVFSSFHHSRIQQVKQLYPPKLYPTIRTAAIFTGQVPPNFLAMAQKVQADEIHLRYDTCSNDRVQAAHQHGFYVMAWFRGPKAMTQDIRATYSDIQTEANAYAMVLQAGVDAICCNQPHLAVTVLQNLYHQDK